MALMFATAAPRSARRTQRQTQLIDRYGEWGCRGAYKLRTGRVISFIHEAADAPQLSRWLIFGQKWWMSF